MVFYTQHKGSDSHIHHSMLYDTTFTRSTDTCMWCIQSFNVKSHFWFKMVGLRLCDQCEKYAIRTTQPESVTLCDPCARLPTWVVFLLVVVMGGFLLLCVVGMTTCAFRRDGCGITTSTPLIPFYTAVFSTAFEVLYRFAFSCSFPPVFDTRSIIVTNKTNLSVIYNGYTYWNATYESLSSTYISSIYQAVMLSSDMFKRGDFDLMYDDTRLIPDYIYRMPSNRMHDNVTIELVPQTDRLKRALYAAAAERFLLSVGVISK